MYMPIEIIEWERKRKEQQIESENSRCLRIEVPMPYYPAESEELNKDWENDY